MVIRAAIVTAFIIAGCIEAAAGGIAGKYKSQCTLPTGAQCSPATAEIEMISENICLIRWSSGEAGVCMLKNRTFSVGYIVHGKAALAVYDICPDGSFEGVFIDDFHGKGIGKETLIPIRQTDG